MSAAERANFKVGLIQMRSGLDPAANYSNSSFDIRNSFKGYAVYELPFGKGKPFLNNNRLLDETIGSSFDRTVAGLA